MPSIFNKKTLKDTLLEAGLVTKEEFESIRSTMKPGDTEFLACARAAENNPDMTAALIAYAGTKSVALQEMSIEDSVADEIPRELTGKLKVFPFAVSGDGGTIYVAMGDPTDNNRIEQINLRTGKNVIPYFAIPSDIEKLITERYGDERAREAAQEFSQEYQMVEEAAQVDVSDASSPVAVIVNSIIENAARLKASDIHIEPFDDKLQLRLRIDGSLVEKPGFSKNMVNSIIARIKIMGGMDIAEKRVPQDGRITKDVDGMEYDIRVSTMPTVYGEKCVMRLAVKTNLQRDKKDLGLSPKHDLPIFDKIFSNPHGIILVTGPTGSGKSTTLYTALSELAKVDVNVITVEDPVEANVPNVNQVQVNEKAGMTFARALRAILRQDPDIIMIGEIRDGETAQIAVQAAITGHLVVSTLHTNSAAASIPRLVDLGVEPYLVADSVVGILAQRLVKKLCPRCKKQKKATPEDLKLIGIKPERVPATGLLIYEKGGCPYCNGSGYQGRVGVYEIMDITPDVRKVITDRGSTEDLKRCAVTKAGMHTLHMSAASLVLSGVTTVEEMKKVSSEY